MSVENRQVSVCGTVTWHCPAVAMGTMSQTYNSSCVSGFDVAMTYFVLESGQSNYSVLLDSNEAPALDQNKDLYTYCT